MLNAWRTLTRMKIQLPDMVMSHSFVGTSCTDFFLLDVPDLVSLCVRVEVGRRASR